MSTKRGLTTELARVGVPVLILVCGIGGFFVFGDKPEIDKKEPSSDKSVAVETIRLKDFNGRMTIEAEGVAVPYRQVVISAEAAGRVTFKSQKCRSGNYVEAQPPLKRGARPVDRPSDLIRIDKTDYELEVARLKAHHTQAQEELAMVDVDLKNTQSLIELAREKQELRLKELNRDIRIARQNSLSENQVDVSRRNELDARNALQTLKNQKAQLEQKKKTLSAAAQLVKAQLDRAQADLARTRVGAPIDGTVIVDFVEQNDYVKKGDPLFKINDVSRAEVKCNLLVEDIYWVWLQSGQYSPDSVVDSLSSRFQLPEAPVEVVFSFAGVEYVWDGKLSRYEGSGLDDKTRTVPCRVLIDDPKSVRIGKKSKARPKIIPPMLFSGMYVKIRIPIKPPMPLFQIPAAALRPGGEIWIADDDRLKVVKVRVARATSEGVYVFQPDDGSLKTGQELIKIEEAIRSIEGIKKVTSIAREGTGNVVVELRSDVPNVQKVLNEIESEIDRIPSFPLLAEEPKIQQLTIRNPAIKIGVVYDGKETPETELQIREVTEQVRDELLIIPQISVANIQGERKYQIDVEISETTLRKYGLSLKDVANRIRMQNVELPGGKIRGDSQVFLLRGKHKRERGTEIAKIPLVTQPGGVVLTVGDLGEVIDGFEDTTSISRINSKPGTAISIEAAAREDMLAMTEAVREYAASKELPPGFHFEVWADRSIDVDDRLELLKKNGLQGLVLVFIVLALFLELRLSFWVALGIPISVLGACAVLWQADQTLNMLSMFAFLIALGIVVDDAIVIGENIYSHREQGKGFLQAAVDGTVEVLPSVVTSVTTTVIAFMPMFFVTGVMGKFFAVLPLAVIAMLVISLFESLLILPCHLAHPAADARLIHRVRRWRSGQRMFLLRSLVGPVLIAVVFVFGELLLPLKYLGGGVGWINQKFAAALDFVINRWYLPGLDWSLRNPAVPITTAISLMVLSVSLVTNGTVPWIVFPKVDARQIQAAVTFPDGTPSRVTEAATKRLEESIAAVNKRYADAGEPVLSLTHNLVGSVSSQSPGGADQLTEGSHAGSVHVELVDNTQRSASSQEIIDAWRKETGEIPGTESLVFQAVAMGPGGKAIEFKLLAPVSSMKSLEEAVEACKRKLATYPGVYDIADDSRPGKWELQLQLKDDARSMGVPLDSIAGNARAAYYGEEVMRLQRGRHEVKLMVRYPESERRSLADLNNLRVDTGDGVKRPLTELAKINVVRGYSEINRVDQMRSITITADIDESQANARDIVAELRSDFVPDLLKEHPGVLVRWEGQQEQSRESIQSLMIGLALALIAMFVLLTLEFTSYFQPAIIMAVIPFGTIGALWGHAVMGLPLTLFSVLGLVALTGVVVNDSIVLVDFINARVREGVPLRQALLESGRRRFRPVLLTSLTTIAGLLPVLSETSMQAQLLIPMATSLCFGLALSTLLVLFLIPVFYQVYVKIVSPSDVTVAAPEEPVDIKFDSDHGDDDIADGPQQKPAHQERGAVATASTQPVESSG
eukprot:g26603.t1